MEEIYLKISIKNFVTFFILYRVSPERRVFILQILRSFFSRSLVVVFLNQNIRDSSVVNFQFFSL